MAVAVVLLTATECDQYEGTRCVMEVIADPAWQRSDAVWFASHAVPAWTSPHIMRVQSPAVWTGQPVPSPEPHVFCPDWTVGPGALLAEWLRENGHTAGGLAAMCAGQLPGGAAAAAAMIADVLERRDLTRAHAELLAHGTTVPVRVWLDYERSYRAGLAAGKTDTRRENRP